MVQVDAVLRSSKLPAWPFRVVVPATVIVLPARFDKDVVVPLVMEKFPALVVVMFWELRFRIPAVWLKLRHERALEANVKVPAPE